MLKIPKLRNPIIKALEREGWDLGRLAVAAPDDLTPITGIGEYTAKYIIQQARQIVNDQGLQYSAKEDAKVLVGPVAPPPPPPSKPEPVPMSARIERIAGMVQ